MIGFILVVFWIFVSFIIFMILAWFWGIVSGSAEDERQEREDYRVEQLTRAIREAEGGKHLHVDARQINVHGYEGTEGNECRVIRKLL